MPPRASVFLGIPGEQLVREPMCWVVGEDRQALEAQIAGAAAGTTQDGAVRAVVHGTVHQHGGAIDLYSEPGLGTTFRIYWPRIEAKGEAAPLPDGVRTRSEGHEIILLVEDEFLVRTVAAKSLARQGYRVLSAETAHAAMVLMESATEVPDLLFTDVILPDKSGPELAVELRRRFPELPVLYASGYSGKLMTDSGHLPPDVDYLQKPYDTATLARRVRAALDRGASSLRMI